MKDRKLVKAYLKNLHRIFNIPIIYIYDNEIQARFHPVNVPGINLSSDYIKNRLFSAIGNEINKRNIFYHIGKTMVFGGLVKNKELTDFIVIGPIAHPQITEGQISDYLFRMSLDSDTAKRLAAYLSVNGNITLDQSINILLNINIILNDEISKEKDIFPIYIEDGTPNKSFTIAKQTELDDFGNPNIKIASDYEQRLIWCVSHGETTLLQDLLSNINHIPFKENLSGVLSIKESKLTAMGAIFTAHYVAASNGTPSEVLNDIKLYYLNRIESANDIFEINNLASHALLDFCDRVRENLAYRTDNPTAARIIRYIRANITTRLSAPDVAQNLHLKENYIFTTIKKELGKTFTQFVNEEKIKKATYYLSFTDNSIIEISYFLSFSSQSYFQTVFKSIMGCTPLEYRQKNLSAHLSSD